MTSTPRSSRHPPFRAGRAFIFCAALIAAAAACGCGHAVTAVNAYGETLHHTLVRASDALRTGPAINNSLKRDQPGDFGWGWSASAGDVSVRKNRTLGTGWVDEQSSLQRCLKPIGDRRITITLPDGGVYRFKARNEPECAILFAPPVNIVMDPLPLPVGGSAGSQAATGQLEVIVGDLVRFDGSGRLVVDDTQETWNPLDFKFTTPEGFKYIVDPAKPPEPA